MTQTSPPFQRKITLRDLVWFIVACACLLVAKLCVRLFPFRTTIKVFKLKKLDTINSQAQHEAPKRHPVTLAVKRAVKYLPGSYVCLPQALAGSALLKLRNQPFQLVLGVKIEDQMQAHAWLITQQQIILGGDISSYKNVGVFE